MMRSTTKYFFLSAIATFALIVAPGALAQTPEVSYLPVTEPLDVGGTILEPGVYVIRVLPSIRNRNILQITNEDRSTVFATVLSVPHPLPPTEEMEQTKLIFYPASNGYPRALRTWYAADAPSDGGHDIVYPQRRAMQLASVVREPVIAFKDETKVEDLTATKLEVVTPDQEIVTYVEPPRPVEPVARTAMAEPMEIPQTAGNSPLLALVGMLLITAALGVRASHSA